MPHEALRVLCGDRMAALLEKHRGDISGSAGVVIEGAADGEGILESHRERPARLIILDTEMPGLAPDKLCRKVRVDRELRKVSLIIIGSEKELPIIERCMANRSFMRPLHREDFLGAVRTLVNVADRKDYRVLISIQVSGKAQSGSFFGKTENISATGILFTTNHTLAAGDVAELMLMLPGHGKVDTSAEIVRVVSMPGSEPKYGARFIDPGRHAFRMLNSFIEKRLR